MLSHNLDSHQAKSPSKQALVVLRATNIHARISENGQAKTTHQQKSKSPERYPTKKNCETRIQTSPIDDSPKSDYIVGMHFKEILARHKWEEIEGCPGRYLLPDGANELTPAEFLQANVKVLRFETDKARDIVLVVKFAGGGLLTYAKENRRYLHTLNTETGLARILGKLAIATE